MYVLSCNMLPEAQSNRALRHRWRRQRLTSRDWQMGQSLLGPSLPSLPGRLLQNALSKANSPQAADFLGQQCLAEPHSCTSVTACHGHSLVLSSQMSSNDRYATQVTCLHHGLLWFKIYVYLFSF